MKFHDAHLAYCTNIHPAESWAETFTALKTHTLKVRERLSREGNRSEGDAYAIGLRLSAQAADELLTFNNEGIPEPLRVFKAWLEQENCYIFTINGFPYGDFHHTRVKEQVYQPDWTQVERLEYTAKLFIILAELLADDIDGSVSTLPGSFKEFKADEHLMFCNLYATARFLDALSEDYGKDFHLGLEPEPLGHFENTGETLAFFSRFQAWAEERDLETDCLQRRIGVNYDTCHFALEFEDAEHSLSAFEHADIRISKIHISSALAFDPTSATALNEIRTFDEATYLHQILIQNEDQSTLRFRDIPEFFEALAASPDMLANAADGRCHFHIPLYSAPEQPLGSTQDHAKQTLAYCKQHPGICNHFEIETYTWGVLPEDLQIPVEQQIGNEYAWVLDQ
ncbi:metabolite traffic protein EboE [Verrucomicrobiaceae bacterium N1E253]|uniref:Metabolite traffic protein EboE n=1 Tax=Oceaniferula marina TaxID=2748318 RepID=A0A851GC32_9BACT|nr:metabolite traffic protein EboE [Oceaniferula marina]NWK54482.1 metabolite traffic protein EboE [Oceaniferula marina]